jgi:Ergosterol biosynthesis ERG4/ERG24 family
MFGLPLLSFLFARYCNDKGWPEPGLTLAQLYPLSIVNEFIQSWSNEVFLIYISYWLFQVALYLVLPLGKVIKGVKLSTGG